MKGNFHNHQRDLWTNHRSDRPWKDSTTRSVVDGQTEGTPRTIHDVRAMCSILRHSGADMLDVDPHGTGRGHPAHSGVTRATRDVEQEGQSSESHGGPVGAW